MTNSIQLAQRAMVIVATARKQGVRLLYLLTAGDAGLALAEAAKPYGISVRCVLDNSSPQAIRDALMKAGVEVRVGDVKGRLIFASEIALLAGITSKDTAWDVTEGWEAITPEP